ncbi:hypothetical protein SD457_02465 [Coprobacillaceae bacterium CR2/5/TPMF4]|nr:hypothetical protein SD457_02465 [Coprobacillaceae bacterium CR2/5/TPMF4]
MIVACPIGSASTTFIVTSPKRFLETVALLINEVSSIASLASLKSAKK